MIQRNRDQWREIHTQALRFQHSELWNAWNECIEAKLAGELTRLDNPKSTLEQLKYSQGVRAGIKTAIIILDDLLRQADDVIKRREHA